MKKALDVTIVGGGVVGLACAYFLNRAGLSVRIFERGKAGHGASLGNMGLLTPSHAHALCRPESLKLGLRSLFSSKAPLKITLTPEMARFRWFARFAGQCTEQRAAEVLRAKATILTASRELTEKLIALERIDCDFDDNGLLGLARTDEGMESFRELARAVEPLGIPTQEMSGEELVRGDSAIRGDLAGGMLFPSDAVINPAEFCLGLRQVVSAKGVEIIEDCEVNIVHAEAGQVDSIYTAKGLYPVKSLVIASGVWSPQLAATIGVDLPIEPGKGYSLTSSRPHPCPNRALLLEERSMAVTPWENGYRIGGTMEFAGFDEHLNRARLMALIDGAMEYLLEAIAPGPPKRWCGFRPMTPDDLPVIGPAGPKGLFFACGHNMLGMSMAVSTGRLLTELVMERKPHLDPLPYSPLRFSDQPTNPIATWWKRKRAG